MSIKTKTVQSRNVRSSWSRHPRNVHGGNYPTCHRSSVFTSGWMGFETPGTIWTRYWDDRRAREGTSCLFQRPSSWERPGRIDFLTSSAVQFEIRPQFTGVAHYTTMPFDIGIRPTSDSLRTIWFVATTFLWVARLSAVGNFVIELITCLVIARCDCHHVSERFRKKSFVFLLFFFESVIVVSDGNCTNFRLRIFQSVNDPLFKYMYEVPSKSIQLVFQFYI